MEAQPPLHTNYHDALRTEEGKHALNEFQEACAPFLHCSAVVAQELRAGVRAADGPRLEAGVCAPYERRGRVIAPSYAAWKETGRVLAELVAPTAWRSVTRSFVNDVLLAMSCREAGAVLVTANRADFARIAKVRQFDFVAPWPWRSASIVGMIDRALAPQISADLEDKMVLLSGAPAVRQDHGGAGRPRPTRVQPTMRAAVAMDKLEQVTNWGAAVQAKLKGKAP